MSLPEILQQALEVAQSIKDPTRHNLVLSRIAELQAKRGDIAAASQIINLIDNSERGEGIRQGTLREIAKVQAKSDDLKGALHTVGAMKDAVDRTNTLGEISAIRAAEGDVSGALQVADEIKVDFWRDSALVDIAQK